MKAPATNKSSPEANTKNRMIVLTVVNLTLLETLHPLRELSFADTPLATDFKGWQFLSLDHPMHGPPGQLQHVSSLLESQQAAQRFKLVFHRASMWSNASAIALQGSPHHFRGKSDRFACSSDTMAEPSKATELNTSYAGASLITADRRRLQRQPADSHVT